MRRALLLFALALAPSAAASPLNFTLYPPTTPEAGRQLTLTVLIENTGKTAAQYNIATCPVTRVTSNWTKKVVQEIKGCPEPLTTLTLPVQPLRTIPDSGPKPSSSKPPTRVTIPAGGRSIFTFKLPRPLPFGEYQAVTTLTDASNGHKATLKAAFTVWDAPQVVQQVVMPPVLLADQPLMVQVTTTNLSSKVFSQDLRLCYTDFVIRDKLGRVVFQTPADQVCTGDLQVTTLKSGERHLENWPLNIRLPAGKYQIQHLSHYGTPMTTFEVK